MTSHRPDLLSLFAGLVFVALGVTALAGGLPLLLTGRWVAPGALIALGIGVLLTVTSDRSGRSAPSEGGPPTDDDPDDDRAAMGGEPARRGAPPSGGSEPPG